MSGSSEFKIQVDPNYKALPGMDHAGFDQKLRSGMGIISSIKGDVLVEIQASFLDVSRLKNDIRNNPTHAAELASKAAQEATDSARFYGLFDRANGRLSLLLERPDLVSEEPLQIRVENISEADEESIRLFIDLRRQAETLYFSFAKGKNVFRLQSYSPWVVD